MFTRTTKIVCVVVACLLLAASAQAGTFLTPTDITASSSFWPVSNLNNDATLTDSSKLANCSDAKYSSAIWVSNLGSYTNQSVTFDFGADTLVKDMVLWNCNNDVFAWSMKDFTLSFATAAEGTGALNTPDTGTYTALKATSIPAEPAQKFDFTDVTARYVRVNIANEYGGNFVIGANEIKFNDPLSAPVPEPGTLALLAASLIGLLAYAWRKR